MLPTFVIGLREGLEAALIVSIVATFLNRNGRPDLLRRVFAGVSLAVVVCAAVGITLKVVSQNLPQRQQEGLETVIGAIAVAMVTYMVVWMRRHSRNLKGQLEGAASIALANGSAMALVLMAFLAVLREGFETSVFLLAAFNESSNGAAAGVGALLGVLVAIALGYGIYRGGVRLNLSKFFRVTGVVLVLVAAGLVVSAFHTAHEAGWINAGQQQFLDLTAVVRPGSVQASLLTGMLGIQERPTVIEFIAWLAYLVPVGLYVAWPPGRTIARTTQRRMAVGTAGAGALAVVALLLLSPDAPARRPVTDFGAFTARVTGGSGDELAILSGRPGADGTPTAARSYRAARTGSEQLGGLRADVYTAGTTSNVTGGRPSTMSLAEVARANGGRLPLGANAGQPASTEVPVTYVDRVTLTWLVDPVTQRILDVRSTDSVQTAASLTIGSTPVGTAQKSSAAAESSAVTTATSAALTARDRTDHRAVVRGVAIVAGLAVLVALGWLMMLRRASLSRSRRGPVRVLVRS